jgi:predicted amidohydrolase
MVALGQLRVDGGQPEVNIKRAVDMITEAGNRGCDIIVLPECLDLGWTDASAHNLAQPIPGEYSKQLCEAARSAAIHVAAGLVEGDGDALYNSAILVSAAGEILLKHRKINELEIAHKLYSRGTSLSVAHTEPGLSWHHDLRR